MRATKYILALVVGSLALLESAQLDLAAVQADPVAPEAKQVGPVKRPLSPKPKQRRNVELDLKATATPPVNSYTAGVVFQLPSHAHAPNHTPAKRGPHVDWEGLVVGDMHIQPNLLTNTDTRYDNSSTRERAQRDELDFLAARQHGEGRGTDPISKLLQTHEPVTPGTPESNDPGYGVAVAIREQLHTPVAPEAAVVKAPAPAAVPRRPSATRPAHPQLAKR